MVIAPRNERGPADHPPESRLAQLTYWSDLANDANDSGRVEVAVDDGGGVLEWQVVDSVGRNERDRDVMAVQKEPAEIDVPVFEQRRVDLTRFAGRTIRLRFLYRLGNARFINVYRMGWYVDDIRLVSGSFDEIGRTTEKRFLVQNRHKGKWTYRVRAVFGETSRRCPRTSRSCASAASKDDAFRGPGAEPSLQRPGPRFPDEFARTDGREERGDPTMIKVHDGLR